MSRTTWFFSTLSLGALLWTAPGEAANPNVVKPSDFAATPAFRYGALKTDACLAELKKRNVAFDPAAETKGVDAPVRITGPMHGVKFVQVNHTHEQSLKAETSILDCRLALALDDFSVRLASRGVTEVGYISAYRKDTGAKVAPGERHPAGMAIDVAYLRQNGKELQVEREFHGRVGARTCGTKAEAPKAKTKGALELRSIVCEAGRDRVFNLVLTPNYNRDHHNHIHFEVRRHIDWFLVQ